MSNENIIKTNVGHILYDKASQLLFDPEWFELRNKYADKKFVKEVGLQQQYQYSATGRSAAFFFTINNQEFVIKHYRRGGMIAQWMKDYYIYSGSQSVRSIIEWQTLFYAKSLSLPVPEPIAARYCLHGLFYTADLITRSCRPGKPLSEILLLQSLPKQIWQQIGLVIRQFHDNGICHADLNAHNILVHLNNKSADITLLDFDKAHRYTVDTQHRTTFGKKILWQQKNLSRLQRSLYKLKQLHPQFFFTATDFDCLSAAWNKS